ncbi:MAG: ABC transporter ATP-binding protein [Candidatus Methanofastidiosia archaeon]|jgi:ABC-2 type transport system ATP-binding protein
MDAIVCENLRRVFVTSEGRFTFKKSKKIVALDDMNFSVGKGELFGLLGPNGAGKTTATRILCTLLLPTAGTARILGYDVVENAKEVQRIVNMVAGGERMLYFRLTARENLAYFAELYNVPKKEVNQRIEDLLKLVGLTERQNEPVERFSKGMKQRLQIARGLINDPDVLLLDEPTLGLDAHIARDIRQFIQEDLVEKRKKTVLLTTHYLYEAEEICHRVAFLHNGKILTIDTPKNLKRMSKHGISIELLVSSISDDMFTSLGSLTGVKNVSVPEGHDMLKGFPAKRVLLAVDEEGIMPKIMSTLSELRIKVLSMRVREPSLEDIFIEMTSGD